MSDDDKPAPAVEPCSVWSDGQHLFSGPTDKDIRTLGPLLGHTLRDVVSPMKTCLCGFQVAGKLSK